jgi:hypothetical protein
VYIRSAKSVWIGSHNASEMLEARLWDSTMERANRKYLTRRGGVEFLREQGYPLSLSHLNKLAHLRQGPPVAGKWGRYELYAPEALLEWAEARVVRPEAAA